MIAVNKGKSYIQINYYENQRRYMYITYKMWIKLNAVDENKKVIKKRSSISLVIIYKMQHLISVSKQKTKQKLKINLTRNKNTKNIVKMYIYTNILKWNIGHTIRKIYIHATNIQPKNKYAKVNAIIQWKCKLFNIVREYRSKCFECKYNFKKTMNYVIRNIKNGSILKKQMFFRLVIPTVSTNQTEFLNRLIT